MKFWPFPIFINFHVDTGLTRLFLDFASSADLKVVSSTDFAMTVECELGTINFWDANRYYAWAHQGTFTNSAGVAIGWRQKMPIRYAMRQMRKAIGVTQFVYAKAAA